MRPARTLIVGVGADAGIGFQTAKLFLGRGHAVTISGRNPDRLAQAVRRLCHDNSGASGGDNCDFAPVDAEDEGAINALFTQHGPFDCVVHNVGINRRVTFADMDRAEFEGMWRANSLATFNVAKAASTAMIARGQGSILFTSASAALRGKPGFGAFAFARGGNRLMLQSLAKEIGPLGVHVAQVHVDGIVNGERAAKRWADVVAQLGPDGSIDPRAVAEAFWYLHHQPRNAWTHELDLRPHKESF